jgi:hypothetical protein
MGKEERSVDAIIEALGLGAERWAYRKAYYRWKDRLG